MQSSGHEAAGEGEGADEGEGEEFAVVQQPLASRADPSRQARPVAWAWKNAWHPLIVVQYAPKAET